MDREEQKDDNKNSISNANFNQYSHYKYSGDVSECSVPGSNTSQPGIPAGPIIIDILCRRRKRAPSSSFTGTGIWEFFHLLHSGSEHPPSCSNALGIHWMRGPGCVGACEYPCLVGLFPFLARIYLIWQFIISPTTVLIELSALQEKGRQRTSLGKRSVLLHGPLPAPFFVAATGVLVMSSSSFWMCVWPENENLILIFRPPSQSFILSYYNMNCLSPPMVLILPPIL